MWLKRRCSNGGDFGCRRIKREDCNSMCCFGGGVDQREMNGIRANRDSLRTEVRSLRNEIKKRNMAREEDGIASVMEDKKDVPLARRLTFTWESLDRGWRGYSPLRGKPAKRLEDFPPIPKRMNNGKSYSCG